MTMTLAELRTLDAAKYPTPTKPVFENPISTVSSIQVTGKEGFFIIQWSPISGMTGYRIAVMTDKELDTPNIGIFTAWGEKSSRYDYLVGNIALTRNFAVQAFRDVDSGPWSAIKSATCSLMTAAGSAEPTNPAPPASSQPPPPSGGGGGGGGAGPGGKGRPDVL